MSIPNHPVAPPPARGFDIGRVRDDFPILRQKIHGKPLVYLDNAATAQKPRAVLDAIRSFYSEDNANIHRGVHQLSERATQDYEEARAKVRQFLNAAETKEIIFVRGGTEAINLVAQTYGRKHLRAGDEILISHMEHHSNIVPWQLLCEATGAILQVVPISDDGEFLFEEYEKRLSPRTKLVSVIHVSNSLGTVNPIKHIIELAHSRGIPVLVDGAQSVAHMSIDVQDLDCDFFVFSAHKLYGPTGIGVLYGKAALMEDLPPYQGGGDMIKSVTMAKTTYADLPSRYEAGTPDISGAIGLGAAIDYVRNLGMDKISDHEDHLLRYATDRLKLIPGVRIIGNAAHKVGAISFIVEDPPLSTLDIGIRLDLDGIAIRTGHHCCQPVMERFAIPGTARISFGLYNTTAEIDLFILALRKIIADATGKPKPAAIATGELKYPPAVASNPREAADELIEVFDFLDNWTERYQHLLELGEKLPPFPNELRADCNRVRGCQSTVFLWMRKKPGTKDVIEFLADSDADLVRGLLGLLQRVFSGQRAEQILAFDVEAFFARLGLDQHLTMGRRNGLAAMVQRIRDFAASLVEPQPVNS